MSRLTRVLLLCGGPSSEHSVSLTSCNSVYKAMDTTLFQCDVVGLTHDALWKFYGQNPFTVHTAEPKRIRLAPKGISCHIGRGKRGLTLRDDQGKLLGEYDVVFPVMHGAYGEDGTIQAICHAMHVPCVGCDMKSSVLSMDKALTKLVLTACTDLAVSPGCVIMKGDAVNLKQVVKSYGLPLFVKPASNGSSIGVTKVKKASDLQAALDTAFQYENKVMVETAIVGRELECAVLEDEKGVLHTSHPGEIISTTDFYDNEAKYHDAAAATVCVEAKLPAAKRAEIQKKAALVFKTLGCSGLSRVDFFLEKGTDRVILNEINTIPGFTNISLYPKMMEKSGVPYPELIRILIANALRRK